MRATTGIVEAAFTALTGAKADAPCADISRGACEAQPRSFMTHAASLAATKTADGLIDPKLVLAWLLTNLGAGPALIGLLVPVREAGALLPQLFTAGILHRLPRRKWAWAAGSAVQGLAALGMAAVALTMDGARAGWMIIGLLAVLAVARSVCSVSYKDVLGKTVDTTRRGTVTGLATSVAATFTIVFAVILMSDAVERGGLVLAAIAVAGGLWLVASAIFATLPEEADPASGETPLDALRTGFRRVLGDRQLGLFILTRGLLISTALAPPFMVALGSGEDGSALSRLGALVLASSLAGLASGYVWGRLADRSSRKVLALTALAAACALGATVAADMAGIIGKGWVLPALLFALMIAYQGVRLGRSTHLVDMATPETRATYTAVSNTAIGVLLLLGGLFGVMAEAYGPRAVLIALGGMAALAVPAALRLDEVQGETRA